MSNVTWRWSRLCFAPLLACHWHMQMHLICCIVALHAWIFLRSQKMHVCVHCRDSSFLSIKSIGIHPSVHLIFLGLSKTQGLCFCSLGLGQRARVLLCSLLQGQKTRESNVFFWEQRSTTTMDTTDSWIQLDILFDAKMLPLADD